MGQSKLCYHIVASKHSCAVKEYSGYVHIFCKRNNYSVLGSYQLQITGGFFVAIIK